MTVRCLAVAVAARPAPLVPTARRLVRRRVQLRAVGLALTARTRFSISADHSSDLAWETTGIQATGVFEFIRDVNPGSPTSVYVYTDEYNGGGYYHVTYTYNVTLTLDLSISVDLYIALYNDSGDLQVSANTTFVVPKDQVFNGSWGGIYASGVGYTNGPVDMLFWATNVPQSA